MLRICHNKQKKHRDTLPAPTPKSKNAKTNAQAGARAAQRICSGGGGSVGLVGDGIPNDSWLCWGGAIAP